MMENTIAEVSERMFWAHRFASLLVYESMVHISVIGRAMVLTQFPATRMINASVVALSARGQRPSLLGVANTSRRWEINRIAKGL